MHKVAIHSADGKIRDVDLSPAGLVVGKAKECDVVLTGWNVARQHARFIVHEEDVFIEDLGSLFGTWVGEARVLRHGPLRGDDLIVIGGHTLSVLLDSGSTRKSDEIRNEKIVKLDHVAQSSDALGRTKAEDSLLKWRRLLHRTLLEHLDSRRVDVGKMKDDDLRSNVRALINEIIQSTPELPAEINRAQLEQQLLDEAIGLGPLEILLKDESVSEVMVNRADEIWVEKNGRLELTTVAFTSDLAVLGAIERIVTPLGRRIDESSPMVDARLKDGSRVNAIIPPLALRGPSLTIRKFPKHRLSAEAMVQISSISQQMVAFIKIAVEQQLNIIVSGGTGTGKTTFLNMLSSFIPNDERIVTIEDAAELSLHQPNLVSLESRPPNVEGKGAVSIRDLVRNSLRMRPDRIVVGECRGGEALDMLQAMNTGHDGSLTTLHANTPRDAISRLEVLVTMAGMNIPVMAIREQIASAVHLIVQLTRFPCGSRKVTQITEVVGCQNGVVQMQDLFEFKKTGTDDQGRTVGDFAATGTVPDILVRLNQQGVDVANLLHAA